jgi:hypothetical protein
LNGKKKTVSSRIDGEKGEWDKVVQLINVWEI